MFCERYESFAQPSTKRVRLQHPSVSRNVVCFSYKVNTVQSTGANSTIQVLDNSVYSTTLNFNQPRPACMGCLPRYLRTEPCSITLLPISPDYLTYN